MATQRSEGRPVTALLLGGATCCLLLAAGLLPSARLVIGSLALACWCAALLAWTAPGGLAAWKLGPWFLAWAAVTSGLATATLNGQQQGVTAQITAQGVAGGLLITTVAVTAWAVGYAAGPRRFAVTRARRLMERLASRRSDQVRAPATPWLIYAAGTAARLVTAVLTGHLGYIGDPATAVSSASAWQDALGLASQACPMAIAVSATRAWRQHARGARLTTAVLFAAEVTYGAVSGNKQVFVVAALALAIPRAAARLRTPWLTLTAAAAVFMLLVIPYTASYRQSDRGPQVTFTVAQAVSGAPAIAGQAAAGISPATLGQSLAYLAQRVREIDGPAIVAQRTPAQIPYGSPVQLLTAPVASLVPRFLWPGKPLDEAGYQFNETYYGTPSDVYSAASVTPWADLYAHGGWVPLAAGMFFLGCLIRVLDDVLDVRDPRAALLVLVLFPVLVKAEADWTETLAAIPGLILVWLVVTAMTFRRADESACAHPVAVTA
jgi:hypothetical protein